MDTQLQQRMAGIKENLRIKKALEIFENAQKTYERAINATSINQKPRYNKGTYSSSLSKKDYYANISTTTR